MAFSDRQTELSEDSVNTLTRSRTAPSGIKHAATKRRAQIEPAFDTQEAIASKAKVETATFGN